VSGALASVTQRDYAFASRVYGWREYMGFIWTIIIGFIAGVIAKLVTPGRNEPSGFILTTILGIVGAFLATFLGQALGWYGPDEGAGLIGAVVGAVIVLLIWSWISSRKGSGSSLR
jgi:uncharacterized membrane protein YeaQ/YmgE (transglycosylase-associated protein family)